MVLWVPLLCRTHRTLVFLASGRCRTGDPEDILQAIVV